MRTSRNLPPKNRVEQCGVVVLWRSENNLLSLLSQLRFPPFDYTPHLTEEEGRAKGGDPLPALRVSNEPREGSGKKGEQVELSVEDAPPPLCPTLLAPQLDLIHHFTTYEHAAPASPQPTDQ